MNEQLQLNEVKIMDSGWCLFGGVLVAKHVVRRAGLEKIRNFLKEADWLDVEFDNNVGDVSNQVRLVRIVDFCTIGELLRHFSSKTIDCFEFMRHKVVLLSKHTPKWDNGEEADDVIEHLRGDDDEEVFVCRYDGDEGWTVKPAYVIFYELMELLCDHDDFEPDRDFLFGCIKFLRRNIKTMAQRKEIDDQFISEMRKRNIVFSYNIVLDGTIVAYFHRFTKTVVVWNADMV